MNSTIINVTRSTVLSEEAAEVKGLWLRFMGFMFTAYQGGKCLVFDRCRHIHTFFMRYDLDVLFLGAHYRVIMKKTLRPWRICLGPANTVAVIELEPGSAGFSATRLGDIISVGR